MQELDAPITSGSGGVGAGSCGGDEYWRRSESTLGLSSSSGAHVLVLDEALHSAAIKITINSSK